MMVLFLHASRMALVVFDPYLSSRPLAEALLTRAARPIDRGRRLLPFSSVMFYSNKSALLLNGRINNLEYGSYAPGSPAVFIDDAAFMRLWSGTIRYYLVTDSSGFARLSALAGPARSSPDC